MSTGFPGILLNNVFRLVNERAEFSAGNTHECFGITRENMEEEINSLERLYSPSKWVIRSLKNGQDVVENFFKIGLKAREKGVQECNCELDVEYTSGKNTKLDIYYPGKTKPEQCDVLIFIHGGYWQDGSKESYAFLASQIKALDCILVLPGYDLAPHESMDGIVQQIKYAVDFIAKKFPDSRIFLCGHSAGAHLCAMILYMDWDGCNIVKMNRFYGVCLISGIYDLMPLLSTSINEPLKMNKEIATRNSPLVASSDGLKLNCRVLVIVGEHESPEFHRQSMEYYQILKEKLMSVTYIEIPGVDHFDMLEKCSEKDSQLLKEILNFMKK